VLATRLVHKENGECFMMKSKNRGRGIYMCVDPEFRRTLKIQASKKNISIIDLTRRLASKDLDEEFFDKKKEEKKNASFKPRLF